ncbi:inosose dehydratase [Phytohabitans flavus]|uniref:Inosose dehydratase n=1 Tax=Phytohabitans flavus TaxID=1076124 RepID=A0A6F8XK00_9ACTN|nr:inosose dehydratase [Phytohabitans flavus]
MGVCEVPGWGYQLPAGRVLDEMGSLGLAATEFGPVGYLPDDPAGLLAAHGLRAVGGFVPAVLHEPARDPRPEVGAVAARYATAGADTVVLAADTGRQGYDARPELDAAGWATLLSNLDGVAAAVAATGLTPTLHPHVGTMVETADDVERVLGGSAVPLCLDTGHLTVGGADPARIAAEHPHRVAHVHLKDVDAGLAARVRGGDVSYTEAVRAGMFRPLGKGDVDIAGIVRALDAAGYDGWYVLEQDVVLAGPDADPLPDVAASVDYLRGL